MEKLSYNEQVAQGGFGRAVPGQSLTNSPEQKYPWEMPPEYTNVMKAQLHLFDQLTQRETYLAITDAIADGVPVDILVRTILYDGYSKGMWDADLLLLLIEPLAVMIMALAERTGLDYVLMDGDQDEYEEDDVNAQKKGFQTMKKVSSAMQEAIKQKTQSIDKNSAALAKEVQQGLQRIPEELVTAAQENIKQKSLLERS
jgi:hypothetical protein